MQNIPLFEDYTFREASAEEFGPFFMENRPRVFNDNLNITVEDWLTDEDKEKQKQLHQLLRDRYSLRVFIMKGDEIVGWHVGRQIDHEQYYMGNTGIFKEYQGKGLYMAILPKLIAMLGDKGFQKLTSRHHASNNRILIAKLKAGFHITGFEVDERFGLFVVLSYFYDEKRRRAYEFRTGAIRPDEDLKKYL